MEKKNKMQWLIDKFNGTNGESMDYVLANTGFYKGSLVMPTGAGKSGVMFEDIIYHILNVKQNQKIIFNIASPILKLEAQSINDLLSVIKVIFKDRINEFMFFINSSDTSDRYDEELEDMELDANRFSDIDKFAKSNAQFAIVASCHKSLEKFALKIDEMKKYATLITYIDESHLISSTRTTHLHSFEFDKEGEGLVRVQLEKLCECDYIYALSATPDQLVTEKINNYNGHNGDSEFFLERVSPEELIANGTILAPNVDYSIVSDDYVLNPAHLYNFMQRVRNENPSIKHKILVNCKNKEELNGLQTALSRDYGCKVFSTCSAFGAKNSEGEFSEEIDEVNFINEVDSYDGDCFVLHIRQLIQGIDIKSLTDCVYCTASNLDATTNKKIIQTIGRILRPLMGERGNDLRKAGKSLEDRLKQYGKVLFIVPEGFNVNQIINFVFRYYGLDKMTFTQVHLDTMHKSGKSTILENDGSESILSYMPKDNTSKDIEVLLIKAEDYVKTKVLPKYRIMKSLGGKFDAPKEIESIAEQFDMFKEDSNSVLLLSNKPLINAIKMLFEKYGIK